MKHTSHVSAGFTLLALSVLVLFSSCAGGSGYEVRMDAVRATRSLQDPVSISLWLYPDSAKKEMTKVFVPGRISSIAWIDLEKASFVEIPASALDKEALFVFRVELNPNRFTLPPDAVFEASIPVSELVAIGAGEPVPLTIQANAPAPFELRLLFRRSPGH